MAELGYGDVSAEVLSKPSGGLSESFGTLTGAVILSASGTQVINGKGDGSIRLSLLNLTPTQRGWLQHGRLVRVTVQDNNVLGPVNVGTFYIEDEEPNIPQEGPVILTLSGPDQLEEIDSKTNDDIISQEYTGNIVTASSNSVQLEASAPASDGALVGWIAEVEQPGNPGFVQGVVVGAYTGSTRNCELVDSWVYGTPGTGTPYRLYGAVATTNDITQLMAVEPDWSVNFESGTGTAIGLVMPTKGEQLLQCLIDAAEWSGEFFRLTSLSPTTQAIDWRRTHDASGFTLVDENSYTTPASQGRLLSFRPKKHFKPITHAVPRGGNFGDGALTLAAATVNPTTIHADYALTTTNGLYAIVNTRLIAAGHHRARYPYWSNIRPTINTTTAQVAAANELVRATIEWMEASAYEEPAFEAECVIHGEVKPGQTINVNATIQGTNNYTVNETNLVIYSVTHSVNQSTNERRTQLVLTRSIWPPKNGATTTAKAVASQQKATRHVDTTGGGAAVGGGFIGTHDHAYLPLSGGNLTGNVTLDVDVLVDGRDISDDGATLDAVAALAHNPVTLATSAQALLALSAAQQLSIPNQAANTFLAGPTSGEAAAMSIRTLHANDIPDHNIIDTHSYQNGSALQVVGLSAPSTLAMLTPLSDTSGGGAALLKSDANGDLKLRRMNVSDRYEMNGVHILSLQGTALFIANSNGLSTITTGYGILAVGDQALGHVTTGRNLVSIGSYSLNAVTDQFSLIAVGASAGEFSTSSQAMFFGVLSGAYQSGTELMAFGDGAASGTASVPVAANSSVLFGKDIAKHFSGSGLVANGNQAVYTATSGGNSVVSGTLAAYSATAVTDSTIVGHLGNFSNASLSGMTSVGAFTNYGNSGAINNGVLIGTYAGYFETSDYRLHVSVAPTTNPLIYGEFNNNLFRMAAKTIEVGDGTNATTLKARAADLTLDVAGGDFLMKTTTDISGESWASGFLGSEWGIDTSTGHADFRSIYTEELLATTFTVENSYVKAGSWWLTPGAAETSRDFTVPTLGGTATLYVLDDPTVPDVAVFQSGDYVLLRVFTGSGASKVIASIWGQVTNYTDLSGGEQSWTFANKSGTTGLVVLSGSAALGFGQSGDGYITMTTLDSAGSPYAQIATWRGNPYTASNRTIHTRWGNLDGIAGIGQEYGIYAGVSPTSARIVASDNRVALHSVPLSLYSGGDNAIILLSSVKLTSNLQASVRPDGDVSASNTGGTGSPNYAQINNDSTASYVLNNSNSTNAEMWLNLQSITTGMSELSITSQAYCLHAATTADGAVLTAQIFKSDGTTLLTDEIMLANQSYDGSTSALLPKRFGYFDSAASQADWNGARLRLRWYYYPSSAESEVIRLDPFVPSIAVGDPLPTAVNTGNGVWMGRHSATDTYRFRVGHATGPKLLWNASSLALYDSGGNVTIEFLASGNAKIQGILNLGTSGGIYQGTGTFASPTTGLKLWNDSGVGRIAGYNGGTLQAGFDTAGKLTAGEELPHLMPAA